MLTIAHYEKFLLSALLQGKFEKEIVTEVLPHNFTLSENRAIFEVVTGMVYEGLRINIPAISLKLNSHLDSVGGEPYLRSLASLEVDATDYKLWCKAVNLSGAIHRSQDTINRLHNQFKNPNKVLSDLLSNDTPLNNVLAEYIDDLTEDLEGESDTGYKHISKLLEADNEYLDAIRENKINVVPVGWPSMANYLVPRFGVLNVVAGLSSSGKTQLCLLMALGVAIHLALNGLTGHVAYNSLEDSEDEVLRRAICALSKIDSRRIKTNTATQKEWQRYLKIREFVFSLPLYINDDPNITTDRLKVEGKLLSVAERSPRVLGVSDYVELFGNSNKKSEHLRLANIARDLHSYARKTGSCEVLVSQYPDLQNGDQIGGTRTKDSRAVWQSCKVFIELWNLKELFNNPYSFPNFDPLAVPSWADKTKAYAFIHKNSGGEKGRFTLDWLPEYTLFRDTKVTEGVFPYDLGDINVR